MNRLWGRLSACLDGCQAFGPQKVLLPGTSGDVGGRIRLPARPTTSRPQAASLPYIALLLTAFSLHAQSLDQLMTRLDQASASFKGARADLRKTAYTEAVHDTDVETGSIVVRRSSPGKTDVRIDITGDDAYSLVVRGQIGERYHPQINQIEVGDLRKYGALVHLLMALGFGMSGRDLKANYNIANLRRDPVGGQPATAIDLTPKPADLVGQFGLQKVELWIADSNQAPLRERVYFKNRNTLTIEYSNVRINPALPADVFDLPKNAKRVKY
jgi:outer membrane lipoprotein-sorting protein